MEHHVVEFVAGLLTRPGSGTLFRDIEENMCQEGHRAEYLVTLHYSA